MKTAGQEVSDERKGVCHIVPCTAVARGTAENSKIPLKINIDFTMHGLNFPNVSVGNG
jgi:hypothetical protein